MEKLPLKQKIAVIVPTIRYDLFKQTFLPAWEHLFEKHRVSLFLVKDGDKPTVHSKSYDLFVEDDYLDFPAADMEVIYNFTASCRSLGFLVAKKQLDPDIYISLDDDILPIKGTDPIQEHIDALSTSVALDWVNTSTTHRMRGLPYHSKTYQVILSHGIWKGVPDLDAIQQFIHPEMHDCDYERMAIPRGVYFPLSSMNFAFRKELLPYAYQAPMGRRLVEDGLPMYDRFDDIWAGLVMKYAVDNLLNAAAVSGYSTVYHSRASNVFINLKKETQGLELNEVMYQYIKEILPPCTIEYTKASDELKAYATLYSTRLTQWQKLVANAK